MAAATPNPGGSRPWTALSTRPRGSSAPATQLSSSALHAQLLRERNKHLRQRDLHQLSRLRTPIGIEGFIRQQRVKEYSRVQRLHNLSGRPPPAVDDGQVQSEIATQTDGQSEWSKRMLEKDEQSLEHLAEADLAYLEMVRTKAGLHHQTAGKRRARHHALRTTPPCEAT